MLPPQLASGWSALSQGVSFQGNPRPGTGSNYLYPVPLPHPHQSDSTFCPKEHDTADKMTSNANRAGSWMCTYTTHHPNSCFWDHSPLVPQRSQELSKSCPVPCSDHCFKSVIGFLHIWRDRLSVGGGQLLCAHTSLKLEVELIIPLTLCLFQISWTHGEKQAFMDSRVICLEPGKIS